MIVAYVKKLLLVCFVTASLGFVGYGSLVAWATIDAPSYYRYVLWDEGTARDLEAIRAKYHIPTRDRGTRKPASR